MKCEFQWVEPKNLRNVWETIKPGLEETAIKAPGGWIPEDVYMRIKSGEAVLHIVTANSRYRGFLVTQSIDSVEGRKMLIWIIYGDGSDDLMTENMDQVRDWAANINAIKIQFQSPRKGWAKVAEKLGFEPVQVIYEMEV